MAKATATDIMDAACDTGMDLPMDLPPGYRVTFTDILNRLIRRVHSHTKRNPKSRGRPRLGQSPDDPRRGPSLHSIARRTGLNERTIRYYFGGGSPSREGADLLLWAMEWSIADLLTAKELTEALVRRGQNPEGVIAKLNRSVPLRAEYTRRKRKAKEQANEDQPPLPAQASGC